jgi:methionyl-tRNA formyltransferase
MGTPAFAVPSLNALLAGTDPVVAVVSQPDRAAGRGRRTAPTPVKAAATRHGIPVTQPPTLRDPTVRETLADLAPDLIVVAAYGNILPRSILDLPPHGCINVHASLLPRHRGAAPIQWALLSGDPTTGITIMRMTESLDAGDILIQRAVPIDPEDTAATLGTRLAVLGAEALSEALSGLKAGGLVARPQDDRLATLAPRIRKEMGRIDWAGNAVEIERRIRAFQPWPTAYTTLHGKSLRCLRARLGSPEVPAGVHPGTVIGVAAAGITVVTGSGTLVLERVQLEGRNAVGAPEFLRGHPVPPGTVMGS